MASIIGGFRNGVAKNAAIFCSKIIVENDATKTTPTLITRLDQAVRTILVTGRPSVINISINSGLSDVFDHAVCILPVNY